MESALKRLPEDVQLITESVVCLERMILMAETLDDPQVKKAVPFAGLFWLYASGVNDLLCARRENGSNLWNAPALAALCRPLQESFLNFYYFAIEKVSDSEMEFRQLLLQRHASYKELDLLAHADLMEEPIQRRYKEAKENFEIIKAKLLAHPQLPERPNPLADAIRRNNDRCLFEPMQDIWARAGMPAELYAVLFRYLSQWAHATPYALSSLRFHKANEEDGAVNMTIPTGLALACSAQLLNYFSSLAPPLIELLPRGFGRYMETARGS